MRDNLKEYDRFSGLDREKRKPSFLMVMLIACLILLVGSLCYDKIVKPHLAKRQQKTEKEIVTSKQETEEVAVSDPKIFESEEKETIAEKANDKPVQRNEKPSSEQAIIIPSPDPVQPEIVKEKIQAENIRPTQPERPQKNGASTHPESEDYSDLSTSEILERQTHARVIEQARQAGVSTEGSTSEILDRITHARVVEQARQAGVSTEGSTSEILDRITHARVVEQARQAGVSTKGSTSEILDRITHARVVEQARQAGVSTEGSTSEILDRITRKRLQKSGF